MVPFDFNDTRLLSVQHCIQNIQQNISEQYTTFAEDYCCSLLLRGFTDLASYLQDWLFLSGVAFSKTSYTVVELWQVFVNYIPITSGRVAPIVKILQEEQPITLVCANDILQLLINLCFEAKYNWQHIHSDYYNKVFQYLYNIGTILTKEGFWTWIEMFVSEYNLQLTDEDNLYEIIYNHYELSTYLKEA